VIESESAALNFKHETEFLTKLKNHRGTHKHILLELGSLTEINCKVGRIRYAIFPLAKCNLRKVLTGKELKDHFSEVPSAVEKATVYENAINIVGAVEFLHHYDMRHLNIKPENVLVFLSARNRMNWMIADFNFSYYQRPRLDPVREISWNSDSIREETRSVQGIF
jgi:serine/threonine protein kinase